MNTINLEPKIESALVAVSAGLTAAGTAGLTAIGLFGSMIPDSIKIPSAVVCSGLLTAGASILTIWHKFVNVYQANITALAQEKLNPSQ